MNILIVEDEKKIALAIGEFLKNKKNQITLAHTIEDSEIFIKSEKPDLVILDINLPDGSGLNFLKKIKNIKNNIPVIIITARSQISDRIEGLNLGADDYLIKPFDLDELYARCNAVYRRYLGNSTDNQKLKNLTINFNAKTVHYNEGRINLTAKEWTVLEILAKKHDQYVTKQDIENSLYESGYEVESNTVEVYISKIRSKTDKKIIQTVRDLGYCLSSK